jgi:hypothetical protein
LKPIMKGTPAASTAARARSTSTRPRLIGFSQKTALPARAAATVRSAWVSVLEQIATVSTSGELTSSSMVITGAPVEVDTPSAAAGTASARPATTNPGDVARIAACSRPIRPHPTMPTRRT